VKQLVRGPLHKDSLQDSSDSIALRGPNVEVSGGLERAQARFRTSTRPLG